MASHSLQNLSCQYCKRSAEADIYTSVNRQEDPELLEELTSGRLFVWQCPHCGGSNLVQRPFMYHDPAGRHMIWLCTEDGVEERVSQMFRDDETLSAYTARVVDSVGDLIEKVKIFDAGLDDIVVEMVKYVTRLEIGVEAKGLRFLRTDGADNEITLAYPKDGQMEMLAVGFNVYEDCAGILQRNPHIRQMATGLVRIDAAWIERFFK